MVIYAYLFLLCVVCVELFTFLDLRGQIMSVLSISQEAIGVLASSSLEDDEKEAIIRRRSLGLFKATIVFIVKLACICIALGLICMVAAKVFPDRRSAFVESLLSFVGIGAMTGFAMCYMWIRNAICRKL